MRYPRIRHAASAFPASISRAAAKAGKKVLHLDPAASYGGHWASHHLDGILAWAAEQQRRQPSDAAPAAGPGAMAADTAAVATGAPAVDAATGGGSIITPADADMAESESGFAVSLSGAAVYSHVTTALQPGADLGPEREYSIDLAPKVRRVLAPRCCASR